VAGRTHAFFSYSHRDRKWLDRLLVLLKPFLKAGRLAAWADPYIQVGDDWQREIAGGLAQAKVAVLLVSPELAASDFITDVELPALLAARQRGELRVFCVPVQEMVPGATELLGIAGYQWARPPDQPLDPLPEADRHTALVRIVGALVECFGPGAAVQPVAVAGPFTPVDALVPAPGGPPGALHGVPDLPPHFVARPEALDGLRKALLNEPRQSFGISASARTGIHGQGGLGKTVLATALAHDPEVRRAFPDGVFWVALGQEPTLLALQKGLLELVTGAPAEVPSIPVGTERLREQLVGKRCLLVVDDVWQASHAQALGVVGTRGRLLVTTRDRQILVGLGADPHDLDKLDPVSALALLASWAGTSGPLPGEGAEIAAECGYLPLALSLAGAQVRKGLSWKEVLAALRDGNLRFLDHPHGSVFKSMRMSVDALEASERARYCELAIFPEDTAIPEGVIARLWSRAGLDRLATAGLLLTLADRGLLRCAGEPGRRMVTVHDLQGDFLRLIAEDLPAVHARLLDAVFAGLPGRPGDSEADRWAALPAADAYLWVYLAHHLLEADRPAALETLARSHCWLAAKMAAAGVAALLSDLAALVQRAPTAAARAVEKAARLESGWLYQDPGALPGLLYNRLLCEGFSPAEIQETVAGLPRAALRLLHPVRFGGGELRVFRGHSGFVHACAYSPDGARILSAAYDNTVREWDRASGQELRRFEGHSGAVTACAYSSDGARILSASSDNTVREWDRASGQELRRFEGHSSLATACAYSPDGARIISASYDHTVREWDRASGRELRRFEGHSDLVNACAYSPDGLRILSASSDNTAREWDRASGQELRRFEGHSNSVNACAYSPDGTRIISASYDHTVREWDRASGQELRRFEGHSSLAGACAYSPDGTRIASASDDHTVREWDRASGRELGRFEGHSNVVTACAYSPDGVRILSASYDHTVREWNRASGQEPRRLEGHAHEVTACAYSPDGARILSASCDKTVREWDRASGQELRRFEGHASEVTTCAYSRDGARIVSASSEGTLREWDRASGQEVRHFEGHYLWINACVYSADGARILSASCDNTVREWDRASGQELRRFEGHSNRVTACAYSPDGARILSASWDRTVREWDRASGQGLRSFEGHSGVLTASAYSPDGACVLSASSDNSVREWDRASGHELRRFEGHAGEVTACVYSPDGARILSASYDNTVRIWDRQRGACLAVLYGTAPFACIAVGKNSVTAGDTLGNLWMLAWDACGEVPSLR
jgi:WD40 repeat protein